ncbi:hypothetical protein Hanom_Chr04g00282231 [Helianthus anomalus]
MKIYKNTNILMDLEDLLDLEHHVQHKTSFGSLQHLNIIFNIGFVDHRWILKPPSDLLNIAGS